MPCGAGQHVLLVDDEAALAQAASMSLAHLGYRVTGVNSAAEALKCFQLHPGEIDLVITDLTMPGMNGIELANALHENSARKCHIILAFRFWRHENGQFRQWSRACVQSCKSRSTTEVLARTVQQMLASAPLG